MSKEAVQVRLICKEVFLFVRSSICNGGYVYHSCTWAALVPEVFKRSVSVLLKRFPIFLLLFLSDLLYALFYTLVSSCHLVPHLQLGDSSTLFLCPGVRDIRIQSYLVMQTFYLTTKLLITWPSQIPMLLTHNMHIPLLLVSWLTHWKWRTLFDCSR
jgi:hypothetical protein